jgi:hypothetical protein
MNASFNIGALAKTKWYEYPVRFAFGGAITVIAGTLASHFGPVLGGLFLAFPAIFPASATLAEVRHDAHKKWSNPLRISSRSRRVYTTLAVETEAVRKADAQQVEKRFLLSGGLCDPAQSDFAAVCGGQNDVAAVQFG